MSNRTFLSIGMVALITVAPIAAKAAQADHVESIQVCSSSLFLIQMQTAGWVYVNVSDAGQEQANRIMTGAIYLLASGIQTGYFNPSSSKSAQCGVQAAEITVLGIQ